MSCFKFILQVCLESFRAVVHNLFSILKLLLSYFQAKPTPPLAPQSLPTFPKDTLNLLSIYHNTNRLM